MSSENMSYGSTSSSGGSESSEECEDRADRCNTCDNHIYGKKVDITEWLQSIPWCESCFRRTCGTCMRTCYSCYMEDGNELVICKACNEKSQRFVDEDCEEHRWYICNEHSRLSKETANNTCYECNANYNYSERHS